MQDYRNEIKDVFAADKQLAAELEYDMRKYEEQLAREKESDQEQLSAAHEEVVGAINSVHVSSAQICVLTTPRPCPGALSQHLEQGGDEAFFYLFVLPERSSQSTLIGLEHQQTKPRGAAND